MQMENLTLETLPKAFSNLTNEVGEIKRILLEKSNPPQPEPDQLLTVQQAAELLNLSVPTLYGYSQRAEIPVCKKGKRLYFSKQTLFEWIKEGKKKTLAETSSEAEQYLKTKKG
jgi:excisionase family DNA binding protein